MSEALVMALEHQVHYGSYDWARVEPMMLKAAAELRRLAAVEQELEALKRAISEAEPDAWICKAAHGTKE